MWQWDDENKAKIDELTSNQDIKVKELESKLAEVASSNDEIIKSLKSEHEVSLKKLIDERDNTHLPWIKQLEDTLYEDKTKMQIFSDS